MRWCPLVVGSLQHSTQTIIDTGIVNNFSKGSCYISKWGKMLSMTFLLIPDGLIKLLLLFLEITEFYTQQHLELCEKQKTSFEKRVFQGC